MTTESNMEEFVHVEPIMGIVDAWEAEAAIAYCKANAMAVVDIETWAEQQYSIQPSVVDSLLARLLYLADAYVAKSHTPDMTVVYDIRMCVMIATNRQQRFNAIALRAAMRLVAQERSLAGKIHVFHILYRKP